MRTDLVVVVPGITGSALADARGRPVWDVGPRGIGRALRTLGGSVRDLALPDDWGDEPAPDGVTATGLIAGFHVVPGVWSPIEGYGPLVRFLSLPRFGLSLDDPDDPAAPPGNLVLFAYDWRLSNRRTAELLKRRVLAALERWRASKRERAEAEVVFVCHSMGGLVARWCADRCGVAEVTRSIVTIGTPHRGSAKALAELVNGVRKGIGPLKADFTSFGRSLPPSYQLLPEYACVEGDGGLRKTTELDLPSLRPGMIRDGMLFHDELDSCGPPSYDLIAVVGIQQPTWTTARFHGERIEPLTTIDGCDRGGDGTVPRIAAVPKGLRETAASIRGAGQGHGALAVHKSVLHQLDFILTAQERVYRGADIPADDVPGVAVDDLHDVGEPVEVTVAVAERRVLEARAIGEGGTPVDRVLVKFVDGAVDDDRVAGTARFDALPAGGYAIEVGAPDDPEGDEVPRVRQSTVVLEG